MHFEMEILNGIMVLETPNEDFKIVIDIQTGEVIHCEFVNVSIQKLNKYVNHAKVRYSKYMNSKALKNFME